MLATLPPQEYFHFLQWSTIGKIGSLAVFASLRPAQKHKTSRRGGVCVFVLSVGIEPTLSAPQADVLSIERREQTMGNANANIHFF